MCTRRPGEQHLVLAECDSEMTLSYVSEGHATALSAWQLLNDTTGITSSEFRSHGPTPQFHLHSCVLCEMHASVSVTL